MMDVNTQLCGVIGNPVKHSMSPAIHNAGYAAQDLNFAYLAFEVEDVAACLTGMRSMPNFRGLSVTIPHKLAVMDHLDEIEIMAQHVGSVNTITNENGHLIGSSTDGLGTTRAFDEAGVDLEGKRVLFLGAGGAVRAVAFAVADRKPANITILGRTPSKVEPLAQDLGDKTNIPITLGHLIDNVDMAVFEHDIIIQGTPMGMYPEYIGQSCVPADLIREDQVAFDMVYRPLKTQFILDAEAAGSTIILGTEMLLQQAAAQYERWTQVDPPIDVMRKALLDGLTD
jgi:shikimate dehydrogenase